MIITRSLKGGYDWYFDDEDNTLRVTYSYPLGRVQIHSLECFLVRVNRKLSSRKRMKKS
jgi:hypothetical protein